MQAVQFSSKATETQKYLYFSCLQSRHFSIFISNPSRSSRLCRWLLPQALKILEYLYIPYSFVKVSLGFFSFFTPKIATSLWQFRLGSILLYSVRCPINGTTAYVSRDFSPELRRNSFQALTFGHYSTCATYIIHYFRTSVNKNMINLAFISIFT